MRSHIRRTVTKVIVETGIVGVLSLKQLNLLVINKQVMLFSYDI